MDKKLIVDHIFPGEIFQAECEQACLTAADNCEEGIENTPDACRARFLACVAQCHKIEDA